MKNLLRVFLKPLNPVDLEFGSRLPRKPYNFFEMIKVIIVGIKTCDKNSFNYFLNFIKYIIIKFCVLIYFPIIIILKILNYKFVVINYWQFGAFAQQMSFLIKDIELEKNSKYFVYVPEVFVINKGLLNIFKKKIKIISNTYFCIILFPLFHSNLIKKSILEYDEHFLNTKTYKINKKISNFDQSFFDFEDQKKKILKKYFFDLIGFNSSDQYAVINLRTGEFYKDYNYDLRNSNPKNYLKAIYYLKQNNFKIICFNSEIDEFKNIDDVFIYSEYVKKINDELEIFVLKEANVFITNMFGPKNVASILCTPSLVCDAFPYSSILPYNNTDITIPKIIEKNKKKLSFKEIFNNGLFHSTNNDKNIKIIKNSSQDILDGLCLILDKNYQQMDKPNNNKFRKIMGKKISCTEGLGSISETFLEKNQFLLK